MWAYHKLLAHRRGMPRIRARSVRRLAPPAREGGSLTPRQVIVRSGMAQICAILDGALQGGSGARGKFKDRLVAEISKMR